MNTFKLLAVSAALSVSGVANAAGYIDLFSNYQTAADFTNDGVAVQNTSSYDPATIIGGYRDLSANVVGGSPSFPNGTVMQTTFNSLYNSNVLSFSNASSVTGVGVVQWDGNQAGIQDLTLVQGQLGAGVGINLLTLGDAVTYTTFETDLNFQFTIGLYDIFKNYIRVSLLTTGAGTESILFSYLDNPLACNGPLGPVVAVSCDAGHLFDITKVAGIDVTFNSSSNPTQALDLVIGPVTTTVPEPSIIGLMGAGLLASSFAGSRRRKGALQA